jgi:hypothetical protein
MTTELRQRDWILTIGRTRIRAGSSAELHMDFNVEKSTKREPNRAVIRVYNLSEQRSDGITTETQVSLEAGYTGLTDLLYTGTPRSVENGWGGVDRVLTIESEDAGRQYSTATLDQNWGPGTRYADILRAVTTAMGIGHGNLDLVVGTFERDDGPRSFPEGFTASGPAWRTLDQLARSAGFRWSVQNGVLQLRRGNRPVDTRSISLSPGTGLIGSPKKDADGKVSVMAYLTPGLTPGRVVVVNSREVSGNYQIKRVRYSGASYSETWQAALNLEPY